MHKDGEWYIGKNVVEWVIEYRKVGYGKELNYAGYLG